MMHMLLKLSKDIYLYFTCYCCLSNDTLTTVNMIENARKVFRQNFNQSLGQGYKQLNLPTPSASRYLHFHRCIVLFYFREPQNRAWNLFHFQPSAQTLVSIVVQLLQVDALLIAEVLHPYLKKEKINVLTPFIKLSRHLSLYIDPQHFNAIYTPFIHSPLQLSLNRRNLYYDSLFLCITHIS